MSGVDNMRGIDYQVSYSVWKLLNILCFNANDVKEIQFESITENEEDMSVYMKDGTIEYIQIKKKAEGYNWTVSEIKDILKKFKDKDEEGAKFVFVTNGSASKDVVELKECLENNSAINETILKKFLPNNNSNDYKALFKKLKILTRFCTSDDDKFPGKMIKEKILRLLHSSNFVLGDSAVNVFNSVWMYVYELSEDCKRSTLDELLLGLERKGLRINATSNNDIPDTSKFMGRKNEVDTIKKEILITKKVIIKGINGIGKTSILSKIVDDFKKEKKCVFWIEMNPTYSVSYISKKISSFLAINGYSYEAEEVEKKQTGVVEVIDYLIDIIKKNEIYFFIDNINGCNIETEKFIKEFIKRAIDKCLTGGLICSTVDSLGCYNEIDIYNKKITEYHVVGLSEEDAQEVFSDCVDTITKDEIREFNKYIGGHSYSLFFLKQLIVCENFRKENLSVLKEMSVEKCRKWILDCTYECFSEDEKRLLLSASIFNYPFNVKEISTIVDFCIEPKYLLNRLVDRNVIIVSENGYYVHDSIRYFLLDILNRTLRKKYHSRLVDYYTEILEKQMMENGSMLYDTIMLWGYHTENSDSTSDVEKKLIDLEDIYLDALWAVMRFGYPFAYSDDKGIMVKDVVSSLQNKKLIKRNIWLKNSYMGKKKIYVLKKFDVYDNIFLEYLCLSRGVSNHLGYIDRFEPNEAYAIQGLICPWEHCIEYMPLPPLIKTKQEYVERIEFLKMMFALGEYDDKSDDVRDMLLTEIEEGVPDDAPDEIDEAMIEKGCPIFGHYCPGGKEQMEYCQNCMQDKKEKILNKLVL